MSVAFARPATAAAAVDSVAVREAARPDTLVRRRAAPPAQWSEQPRFVMLRSLVLPGWGQFHNRAYVKSAIVAGGEAAFAVLLIQDKRELDRLLKITEQERAGGDPLGYELAVTRYNARLETYVSHQWRFAGVLAYALVDAYVDAHFRDFDIEFRMDPALPDGAPPERGQSARGSKGGVAPARIALRWNF